MGVTVKKCHRIMSAGMTAGTERVSVAAKRYRVNSTDGKNRLESIRRVELANQTGNVLIRSLSGSPTCIKID